MLMPGAELVLISERVHDVESAAEIDCELFKRFPFVLQIEPIEIAVFAIVIDDTEGDVARLITIGIGRENQRYRSDRGLFFELKESAAERVLIS